MEVIGCAIAGAICTYAPVPNRCGRPQVLPAYGLQDSRNKHQDPRTRANPNTMCLPSTLGEDPGTGHFYLAKNRTFLLCVDTIRRRLRAVTRSPRQWNSGPAYATYRSEFQPSFEGEVAAADRGGRF